MAVRQECWRAAQPFRFTRRRRPPGSTPLLSAIRKLRTYRRLATCQADLERAPLSMAGSLFLSSNVHPGCGRRGPHANVSRRRRAGILPAPARCNVGWNSRASLYVYSPTQLCPVCGGTDQIVPTMRGLISGSKPRSRKESHANRR